MKSITELSVLIQKGIETFCDDGKDDSIMQPVNYLLSLGGKRIRPLITLVSAQTFTSEIEAAIHPALAIEVFHNFTLMHDDIMDNAPLRRCMPTVHEKWNNDAAILSGDAMLIRSYELLCKTNNDQLPA
ncbi:MAG: polyprenyl synthetase family protein, partial [Flavobacteriales bacterium]